MPQKHTPSHKQWCSNLGHVWHASTMSSYSIAYKSTIVKPYLVKSSYSITVRNTRYNPYQKIYVISISNNSHGSLSTPNSQSNFILGHPIMIDHYTNLVMKPLNFTISPLTIPLTKNLKTKEMFVALSQSLKKWTLIKCDLGVLLKSKEKNYSNSQQQKSIPTKAYK